jgi:hypothetical protein
MTATATATRIAPGSFVSTGMPSPLGSTSAVAASVATASHRRCRAETVAAASTASGVTAYHG